jgi:4-carboxymuconolactone decarboxylase
LRRARDNGVTREEIAALITRIAFHAGFPAAVSASIIASSTLSE